jgi:hypothetical protein
MKKQTNNNRVQSKGWSHGILTDKKRTSINLDSDIGKMIESKSKESGLFVSRIINDSLRSHFNMVIKSPKSPSIIHKLKKIVGLTVPYQYS